MRSDRQSTDLHYFHMYATRDRVDLSGVSDEPPSLDPDPVLSTLIPSDSDRETMMSNFGVLVARTLCQYMPYFEKHFSDVVVSHIPHPHETEMEKVSEVVIYMYKLLIQNNIAHHVIIIMQVPLGVLKKNEMKYDDMIEVMEHVHQYVPTNTDTVNVDLPGSGGKLELTKNSFHKILFGGDQLTAKRARGSQMIRSNSITSSQQISGLVPTAEDWHTKLCFLEVSCNTPFNSDIYMRQMYVCGTNSCR